MTYRTTADLDLTIVAEPQAVLRGLSHLGWTQHERYEHRWRAAAGVPVDVLPVSQAAIDSGFLEFPASGTVMSVVGFDLLLAHVDLLRLEDATDLEVATLPVIALLKMTSWLDRPEERDRDLADLAAIFRDYLSEDDERHWDGSLFDHSLDWGQHSAFAVGYDVGRIIESRHAAVLHHFLALVSDEGKAPFAHFARHFSPPSPEKQLVGCLQAFERGLCAGRSV